MISYELSPLTFYTMIGIYYLVSSATYLQIQFPDEIDEYSLIKSVICFFFILFYMTWTLSTHLRMIVGKLRIQ